MSVENVRIGYDLDDVLLSTGAFIVASYNQQFHTGLTLEDWSATVIDPARWGVSDFMQAVGRVNEIFVAQAQDIPLLPGAEETVSYMHEKGAEQYVVTGRSDYTERATIEAVETLLPGIFSGVVCTNFHDHIYNRQVKRSKADVYQEFGLDVFMEDLPPHAQPIRNIGGRAILFGEYPWNRDSDQTEGLERVADWASAQEVLVNVR